MRSENLKWWGEAIKPEDQARVQSLKLPDAVFDDGMDLYLGRRWLELRFFPGHTGGDTLVSVPDAKIVFCGDLLWKDHVPNLIDASTEQWIATLDELRSHHPGWGFVPGHGGIADSEDITIFRGYLVGLRTRVRDAQAKENLTMPWSMPFCLRYGTNTEPGASSMTSRIHEPLPAGANDPGSSGDDPSR